MKEIIIDCLGVECEADFWARYVEAVGPDGAEYFGRNTAALWDAVSAGGPGWPGECKIRIVHSVALAPLSNGAFLEKLKRIAAESMAIQITME